MTDLDLTSINDYNDVVTLPVPPNTSHISNGRKKLVWIILSTVAVLIILAIIIPISVIFTKKAKTNITTVNVTNTSITIPTTIVTTTTITKPPLHVININSNTKWAENGTIVAGSYRLGNRLNELLYPEGIYVDDEQTIYIADTGNHRIVEWKSGAKNGQIVAGGNGKGNRSDQLNNPTNVIVDKEMNSVIVCDTGNDRVVQWSLQNGTNGQVIITNVTCYHLAIDNERYLYVPDYRRHEVRRWWVGNTSGILVAGGNGRGNRSDQLYFPYNIFVDQNHFVYITEGKNCRVTKWKKDTNIGIVVAGGHGEGSDLTQLSSPHEIVVDQLNTVYVVDGYNNRIMRWFEGATQGSIVIGGNGGGEETNQVYNPIGLSFDQQGNLYVSENENHRVQRFNINLNSTF